MHPHPSPTLLPSLLLAPCTSSPAPLLSSQRCNQSDPDNRNQILRFQGLLICLSKSQGGCQAPLDPILPAYLPPFKSPIALPLLHRSSLMASLLPLKHARDAPPQGLCTCCFLSLQGSFTDTPKAHSSSPLCLSKRHLTIQCKLPTLSVF